MIKQSLQDIARMCGGTLQEAAHGETVICGVSTDSRTLPEGSLFVPLVGEKFDGHAYIQAAIQRGAAAAFWQTGHELTPPEGFPIILVEDTLVALQELARSYRSQLSIRVVGVTGSNGKTTTKDLTAALLGTTYKVLKTQGNLNNHIGLPLTLLQLEEQTEMAVIEMGMSGRGEIELLSRLAQPEAAIITNIGESHLLQLGSREEIARAKLEIMSGLKNGGLLVYNGDEPLLSANMPLMPQPEQMLTYRFGFSDDNDIYPVVILSEPDGTSFTTNLPGSLSYRISLLGHHNVINTLAAIAVSKYMGVQDADITEGLKHVQLTGMRIEQVHAKSGAVILNDAYNASPTSMRAAIDLLVEMNGYRRKIAVVGDMLELGPDEAAYHEEIGERLADPEIDLVFAYGTLSKHIASKAAKGGRSAKVRWYSEKNQLIDAVANEVKAGDIVLVKASRGMRLEEVVHVLRDIG